MTRIDVPFIDCHTHIGHLPGTINDVYTAEDLSYICEHEGADFMLVSSASATTISQSYATAEAIAMVQAYGHRLGAMLWINPHDPSWAADTDRAVQHAFGGIKIHPVLDHYAVERPALDEVFACAHEHGWPILTHAGSDGTPMSASRYEPLIKAYPEVTLILAHLRLEAIPLAKRYGNVYLDTTHVDPMIVELAVDALGPDRFLFGTDAPAGFDVGHVPGRVRPRRSYAGLIHGLRARAIPDVALEKILYQNARVLFKLCQKV